MKRLLYGLAIGLVGLGVVTCTGKFSKRGPASYMDASPPQSNLVVYNEDEFHENHGDDVAPGDKAAALGREIWIKATAGNARFFAYTLPQRVSGKSINWPDMLLAEKKTVRFYEYGLINDPDCCSPAVPGECEAKFPGKQITSEKTYGFDYCPGDDELLSHVGEQVRNGGRPPANGYYDRQGKMVKDPACSLGDRDVSVSQSYDKPYVDPKLKQSSCDLEFGTSTGTVGLRKFPNPRFDAKRWEEVGGWKGYINFEKRSSGLAAVDDHSIEPPFRIGMACAHCHAGYSPTRPPLDVRFPRWENINTMIGNQYLMSAQIWASGFRKDHISMQSLAMSRPGTVDTSAVPNDASGNAGTINAVINLKQRPTFPELVDTWRPGACSDSDERKCWCEPGKPGKCWSRYTKAENVPHILKGGEDSVGYFPAIQRVYFNIGSCSEQCWLNHLSDMLVLDTEQRNYGETPFDVGQCRRDCPQFRAIEDRVDNIGKFFFSARPRDMKNVMTPAGQHLFPGKVPADRQETLIAHLEQKFGAGSVKRGAIVYAQNCAGCHSSQKPAGGFEHIAEAQDPVEYFLKAKVADPIFAGQYIRNDWLGNDRTDETSKVNAIGTNSCRARHSNHMKGSVYEEYGSESLRSRNNVSIVGSPLMTGGRGYYRNISLLNVWAHAPFMHNNAIGPELCGDARKWPRATFLANRDDRDSGRLSYTACDPFDPSFEGRFEVYVKSMEELLTKPEHRRKKAMLTTEKVELEIVPKFWKGVYEKGKDSIRVTFPDHMSSQLLASFRHKEFAADLSRYMSEAGLIKSGTWLGELFGVSREFRESLEARFPGQSDDIIHNFHLTIRHFFFDSLDGKIKLNPDRLDFYLKTYSNCIEDSDNKGHPFGTALTSQQKYDLTAFMALL